MPKDTIAQRLIDQAKVRPHAPALHAKEGGRWKATTYQEYADDVRRAGKALLSIGFPKGSTVSLLGFNRPEWVILHVGCLSVGGAGAGIYTTCSPEEVRYIVHHAESPLVLVENEAQWKKIEKELPRLPLLKHVVTMRGCPAIDHPMVTTFDDFLKKGDAVADSEFFDRVASLEPDDLASLIYTSGTTGPPKGVMLSHENLAWTASAARDVTGARPTDVSLSYLPLSHIAEQMFSVHVPITTGGSVYFAESIEKVPDNLKEVQPTVFFGVPRIWEKFHSGISGKLRDAKGMKKRIAAWASDVGRRAAEVRNAGGDPSGMLALQYALANKLVYSKLKPAIGLGRARICVTGAAPVAKEILEFFSGLDIHILEVYGQSEDTGPTSFNRPGRCKLGTVGPVFPGVEVKLADDGEILVRGPNVFLGYYKEPEATKETLIDGWLHSGDLGAFDSDGFLSITGRKKEIIITAGGKNIAPKNIEGALKNHPLVGEVVVIGDRRKYLTALVALDPDAAKKFAEERALPTTALHQLGAIRDEIQKAVDEVNATLARVETVKRFTVLPRPLTIDDGELTPTLKVKRKIVAEHFADAIETMYAES